MEIAIVVVGVIAVAAFVVYKLNRKVERERPVVTPRPRPGEEK